MSRSLACFGDSSSEAVSQAHRRDNVARAAVDDVSYVSPVECHELAGQSSVAELQMAAAALCAGDALTRAELEARVLADQSADEIARHLRLPGNLIEVFEARHFDVRHRLDQCHYIAQSVLGLTGVVLLPTRDVGHLWRVYAYLHGPFAINALIDGVDRDQLLRLGLDAYFEPSSRLPYSMQAAIATNRLPVATTTEQHAAILLLHSLMSSGATVPGDSGFGRAPRLLAHQFVIDIAQHLLD